MFLPKGLLPGDVVDPERLTAEFMEASRDANNLNQWSFLLNTFNTRKDLEKGTHVDIDSIEFNATMQVHAGQSPILPNSGGAATDLWNIPYNRGLAEVGGGDTFLEWTSEYPQLLVAFASPQYVRASRSALSTVPVFDVMPRVQIRMSIDGTIMGGSGPFALPSGGTYKNSGLGKRSGRYIMFGVTFLPAGNHRLVLVAGQAPAGAFSSETVSSETIPLDTPPNDKICIGTRSLIRLCFARGGEMRA